MPRIRYNGKMISVQNEGYDTKTTIDQVSGVGDEKQYRGVERPAQQPINNPNG
jgi:hypothetical protein